MNEANAEVGIVKPLLTLGGLLPLRLAHNVEVRTE